MFGRQELARLHLQKQALVMESDLNRFVLQNEYRNLRAATAWIGDARSAWHKLRPLLYLLAPLLGFLAVRGARRSESRWGGLAAIVKWIQPIYTLWKNFSRSPEEPNRDPAAEK